MQQLNQISMFEKTFCKECVFVLAIASCLSNYLHVNIKKYFNINYAIFYMVISVNTCINDLKE